MRHKHRIEIETEATIDTGADPTMRTDASETDDPLNSSETDGPARTESDPSPTEAASDSRLALQDEIEALHARAEEAERRVLYTQAEFQNFRRRKEEEMVALAKFTNAELIKNLLPIVDNFERALKAAEQSKNLDALMSGVSGTLKQIQTFLQKAGVTPIEAVGQEFDPNFHEAIGHTESDIYPAHTVAEEVQRGYILHFAGAKQPATRAARVEKNIPRILKGLGLDD